MSNALLQRAVIRVGAAAEGEDPAAFLQGLVTNDVTATLPVYAGLLSAQGKTLFDFIVWPSGGGDGAPGSRPALLLDCERDAADELVKRLSLYRLRRPLAIARDETLGVFWQAPLGDAGPERPGVPAGRSARARDPRLAGLGQRWIAVIDGEPPETGADAAWRAHRLSLGVPEGRAELGDLLWLETNAAELNGVSFTKGCYVGQENTARMNWRQKINRRLVVVPLGRSDAARRKAEHPALGYAIDHLRVDAIPADLVPAWMKLERPASA